MNSINEKLIELSDAIVDYDQDKALDIVRELISISIEPKIIIDNGLIPGIEIVKNKFEKLEYFLPEL
ncbi:MAG: hypothetical protein GT601_18510, partial [Acidaminobacter sp.]|uniref:B12-binding domain-containing protein n=1 Tax=Acidaminobacter sp. TaxID=1872102 RepID=UPI00137E81DC